MEMVAGEDVDKVQDTPPDEVVSNGPRMRRCWGGETGGARVVFAAQPLVIVACSRSLALHS